MKTLFLLSLKIYLNKKNICETYFKIIRLYDDKKKLTLYELKELYDDMQNYSIFIMYNVNKYNLYLYSDFYKSIREKKEQIKKLINNKILELCGIKKSNQQQEI